MSCILYHDYRSRSCYDWTDLGHNGTPTLMRFTGSGIIPLTNGTVLVDNFDDTKLLEGTLVYYDSVFRGGGPMIHKYNDAVGTSYALSIPSALNAIYFTDSASVTLFRLHSIIGKKYIAVSFKNGEIPKAYVDGTLAGNLNSTCSMSQKDGYISITSNVSKTTWIRNNTRAALIFNHQLTADEHLSLFNQLEDMKWKTKRSVHYFDMSDRQSYKTDWGINQSVANVTGTKVENSDIFSYSGNVKIEVSAVNGNISKVIRAVDLSTSYIYGTFTKQSNSDLAYGEWKFVLNKVASATGTYLSFISSDKIYSSALNDGYAIKIDNTTIYLTKVTAGVVSTLDSGSFSGHGAWTKITITRDVSDNFSVKVNGVETLTANDGTYTTSDFMSFTLATNDKLSISSLDGDNAIIKKVA